MATTTPTHVSTAYSWSNADQEPSSVNSVEGVALANVFNFDAPFRIDVDDPTVFLPERPLTPVPSESEFLQLGYSLRYEQLSREPPRWECTLTHPSNPSFHLSAIESRKEWALNRAVAFAPDDWIFRPTPRLRIPVELAPQGKTRRIVRVPVHKAQKPRPQIPPTDPIEEDYEGPLLLVALSERGQIPKETVLAYITEREYNRFVDLLSKIDLKAQNEDLLNDSSSGILSLLKEKLFDRVWEYLKNTFSPLVDASGAVTDYARSLKDRLSEIAKQATSGLEKAADVTSALLKSATQADALRTTFEAGIAWVARLTPVVIKVVLIAAVAWTFSHVDSKVVRVGLGILLAGLGLAAASDLVSAIATQLTSTRMQNTEAPQPFPEQPAQTFQLPRETSDPLKNRVELTAQGSNPVDDFVASLMRFIGIEIPIQISSETVRAAYAALSGANSLLTLVSKIFNLLSTVITAVGDAIYTRIRGWEAARKLLNLGRDYSHIVTAAIDAPAAFTRPAEAVSAATEILKYNRQLTGDYFEELKLGNSHNLRYTKSLLDAVATLVPRAEQITGTHHNRIQPVGLIVCGPPGVGKSTWFAPVVASAILEGIQYKTGPHSIFHLVQEDRFMSAGYNNQPIILADDFFNVKNTDVATDRLNLLMAICSANCTPLPSPVAERKGNVHANNLVFIGTENTPFLSTQLANPDAVPRRIMFVQMNVRPTFSDLFKQQGQDMFKLYSEHVDYHLGNFQSNGIRWSTQSITLPDLIQESIRILKRNIDYYTKNQEIMSSIHNGQSLLAKFGVEKPPSTPDVIDVADKTYKSLDGIVLTPDPREYPTLEPGTSIKEESAPKRKVPRGNAPTLTPSSDDEDVFVPAPETFMTSKDSGRRLVIEKTAKNAGHPHPVEYSYRAIQIENTLGLEWSHDYFQIFEGEPNEMGDDELRAYLFDPSCPADAINVARSRGILPKAAPVLEDSFATLRRKKSLDALPHIAKSAFQHVASFGYLNWTMAGIALIAAGAAATAAFYTIKHFVSDEDLPQGYDSTQPSKKKTKFATLDHAKQPPTLIAQGFNLEKRNFAERTIAQQFGSCTLTTSDGTESMTTATYGLAIDNRTVLVVFHGPATVLAPPNRPHSSWTFTLPNSPTYQWRASDTRYHILSGDAILLFTPMALPRVKDIRSQFVSDHDLTQIDQKGWLNCYRFDSRPIISNGKPSLAQTWETARYLNRDEIVVAIPGGEGSIVTPNAVHFTLTNENGDCGKLYMAMGNECQGSILGIHSAGNNINRAACTLVTRESLGVSIAKPYELNAQLLEIPENLVPARPLPSGFQGIIASPADCVVTAPRSSCIVPSTTQAAGIRKPIKKRAHLQPLVKIDGQDVFVLKRIYDSVGKLPFDYKPATDVGEFLDHLGYAEWDLPTFKSSVLTQAEASELTAKDTSKGGFDNRSSRKKRDHFVYDSANRAIGYGPILKKAVDDALESILQCGHPGYKALHTLVMKDEVLDPIKVDTVEARTRGVVPAPLPLLMLTYQYFHKLQKIWRMNNARTGTYIGETPGGLHQLAYEHTSAAEFAVRFGRKIARADMDLSKADLSTPCSVKVTSGEVLVELGRRYDTLIGDDVEKNARIRRALIQDNATVYLAMPFLFTDPQGQRIEKWIAVHTTMVVSGEELTADLHNIGGAYRRWKAYRILFGNLSYASARSMINHSIYSDDGFVTFLNTDSVTPQQYLDVFNSLPGPTAVFNKPSIAANGSVEPAFLQRIIVSTDKVRFALKEDSIASELDWVSKTLSRDEATRLNYLNAIRSYADYGREHYYRRRDELNKELAAVRLAPILLTWEQALIE